MASISKIFKNAHEWWETIVREGKGRVVHWADEQPTKIEKRPHWRLGVCIMLGTFDEDGIEESAWYGIAPGPHMATLPEEVGEYLRTPTGRASLAPLLTSGFFAV